MYGKITIRITLLSCARFQNTSFFIIKWSIHLICFIKKIVIEYIKIYLSHKVSVFVIVQTGPYGFYYLGYRGRAVAPL